MDAMSTVPGSDAWKDAGLAPVDPDGPRSLDGRRRTRTRRTRRSTSRGSRAPDRDGRADEADVVEQDTEVPADDEDADT